MPEYRTNFTDNELKGALGKHTAKANDLLKDHQKMSLFITKPELFMKILYKKRY